MKRVLRRVGPLALIAGVVLPAVVAQDDDETAGGLQRVEPLPDADAPAPADPSQPFDATAWAARLADPNLVARERAFSDIVALASIDPAAVAWLEGLAGPAIGGELGWTARLALREIERTRVNRFDVFGDPFRTFGDPFPGLRIGPDGASDIGELRRRLDELFGRVGGGVPGAAADGRASGQSVSVRQDGDGCTVEVVEIVDGEEQRRTYEGESLEQVLEAHPELRELVQGGVQLGVPSVPRLGDTVDATPDPRVLGVFVSELPDDVRAHLGLEGGVGVYVRSVVPLGHAHRLGIAMGDVLVELDGRAIDSLTRVSEIMGARDPKAELRAVWYDAWGNRRSRSWRP